MNELGKKVDEASYVKKNPKFEERKSRFFSTKQEQEHDKKVLSVMRKIGFYQLEENNLDYIKGVLAAK